MNRWWYLPTTPRCNARITPTMDCEAPACGVAQFQDWICPVAKYPRQFFFCSEHTPRLG